MTRASSRNIFTKFSSPAASGRMRLSTTNLRKPPGPAVDANESSAMPPLVSRARTSYLPMRVPVMRAASLAQRALWEARVVLGKTRRDPVARCGELGGPWPPCGMLGKTGGVSHRAHFRKDLKSLGNLAYPQLSRLYCFYGLIR